MLTKITYFFAGAAPSGVEVAPRLRERDWLFPEPEGSGPVFPDDLEDLILATDMALTSDLASASISGSPESGGWDGDTHRLRDR